jgi:phytoene desaturase
MYNKKKAIVIGSGFAGMSCATFLANNNWDVTVIEKNSMAGGRAQMFAADGFSFDMGPSWYWMPEVFENFFAKFGKHVSDYYTLKRLSPSYRVYWENEYIDVPSNLNDLIALFEKIETGAGKQLKLFLAEAKYKYDVGVKKLVFKPGLSVTEFIDMEVMKGVFKLDIFQSMKTHVAKFFKHKMLQQLIEFPVLFLGAMPKDIPALYSLMNYADIELGTWFPMGGMYKIVEGMHAVAKENGVQFLMNESVTKLNVEKNKITSVSTSKSTYNADVIVAAADYNFVEQKMLDKEFRNYDEAYWDKKIMAPSSLLYYIGINKQLKNRLHHTLFFDTDFEEHAAEIYDSKSWPRNPLFYVSNVSATDESLSPKGCDNLFFLIPISAGLKGDTEEIREKYFEIILNRFEQKMGEGIRHHIIYKRTFAVQDFETEYNSYKGNAYGLANTLMQTAILKPSCKNKKLSNLYYTGQLTVPGPGVPPSIISGEVVSNLIIKEHSKLS